VTGLGVPPDGLARNAPGLVAGSATEAAQAIRRRRIGARELTELVLARIEALNQSLNAVIELRAEAALAEAAVADRAVCGGLEPGPLHGVPITVKEAFDVAGMHTTWGNPAAADQVAARETEVVRRLRRAGAIVVGKTNVAFMLSDFGQTANALHGTTNNPWDPRRTPGGSSGGSAAAVAAPMTFLDYGSDLVGSIRIPASFCGVYGHRPSMNVVPPAGFQPPGPPAPDSDMLYLSALGPFARSAADLRLALRATAGPHGTAAHAYEWRLAPPRHVHLADFRVGVVLDDPGAPVCSDVGARLSDAVDALARAGATVVEGWPPGIDPARSAESFGAEVRLFFAFAQGGPDELPLAEVVQQERRRMAARVAWTEHFGAIDVFLCPTNFTTAFPHDPRPLEQRVIATADGERPYSEQPFWTAHPALAGLPALSAPIGLASGGMPVGAQIIGPPYEDDTAITFAELLAEVVGGYQAPPAPPVAAAR
jgi:amidase